MGLSVLSKMCGLRVEHNWAALLFRPKVMSVLFCQWLCGHNWFCQWSQIWFANRFWLGQMKGTDVTTDITDITGILHDQLKYKFFTFLNVLLQWYNWGYDNQVINFTLLQMSDFQGGGARLHREVYDSRGHQGASRPQPGWGAGGGGPQGPLQPWTQPDGSVEDWKFITLAACLWVFVD